MDVHVDPAGNIVVDRRTVEGFASRVDSIFGGLLGPPSRSDAGPSEAVVAPPWALSSDIVYRAGKEDDYSSDEEEEAAEHERMRNEQLPGTDLNSDGEEAEDLVKPSVSFCKALDNEEEYDQTDAIASTSLGRFGCVVDAKPDRNMEVLDDNIYDQRARDHHDVIVRQAEAAEDVPEDFSGPTAMDVEEEGPPFPLPQTLNPLTTAPASPTNPTSAQTLNPMTAATVLPTNPTSASTLSRDLAMTAAASSSNPAPPLAAPRENGTGNAGSNPTPSSGGGTPAGLRGEVAGEGGVGRSGEGAGAHARAPGDREPDLEAAVERVERAVRRAEDGEKPRKRVRFKDDTQVWVPPHRREGWVKPAQRQSTEGGQPIAVQGPGIGRGPAVRRQGQGRVPDYVLHPEKYTMYTLDEPLIVGGGGGDSDGQADMLKAARAAQSAAQSAAHAHASSMEEDTPRELPAFGAGIEFRRKDKPVKAAQMSGTAPEAGPKPPLGPRLGLLNLAEDELPDAEDVEPMDEEGVSSAAGQQEGLAVFAVRAPKQRKLRHKTSGAEDSTA